MIRHMVVLSVVGMLIGRVGLDAHQAPDGTQQAEETTVAGCLQAGANDGEFVLVNDEKKTAYQVHHKDFEDGLRVVLRLGGPASRCESPPLSAGSISQVSATLSGMAPLGDSGPAMIAPH